MRTSTLRSALVIVGGLLAAAYLVGGILGGLLFDWDDDGGDSDRAFWLVFTLVGGALLAVGLAMMNRSRGLAALLVSLGAIIGAVVLVWTIFIPIIALAIVVLAVMWARRPAAV